MRHAIILGQRVYFRQQHGWLLDRVSRREGRRPWHMVRRSVHWPSLPSSLGDQREPRCGCHCSVDSLQRRSESNQRRDVGDRAFGWRIKNKFVERQPTSSGPRVPHRRMAFPGKRRCRSSGAVGRWRRLREPPHIVRVAAGQWPRRWPLGAMDEIFACAISRMGCRHTAEPWRRQAAAVRNSASEGVHRDQQRDSASRT